VYLRLIPVYMAIAAIIFVVVLKVSDQNLGSEFSSTFWLMACAYFFIPFTAYRAYLEATQKTSLVNLASTMQMIFLNLAAIGFSLLGWGLLGQGFALFLSISFFYLLMAFLGTRKFDLSLWKGQRQASIEKKIWSHGRKNFYLMTSQNLGLDRKSVV